MKPLFPQFIHQTSPYWRDKSPTSYRHDRQLSFSLYSYSVFPDHSIYFNLPHPLSATINKHNSDGIFHDIDFIYKKSVLKWWTRKFTFLIYLKISILSLLNFINISTIITRIIHFLCIQTTSIDTQSIQSQSSVFVMKFPQNVLLTKRLIWINFTVNIFLKIY